MIDSPYPFREREDIHGVIICDSNGLPIDSTLPIDLTEEVSAYVAALIEKSRQIIDALKEGALKFIRLESSKGEVIIALTDAELILIILKGEKRMKDHDDGDRFPYPYVFKPPGPPDDIEPAFQAQEKTIKDEVKLPVELDCPFCGYKIAKGQKYCPICGKDVF
jgi:predicted regulator of Ras-like GTPase activity (Roadblock/LC7/MglB family)